MRLTKEQRGYLLREAQGAVNSKIDAACGKPPDRHFDADALVGVKLTREQAAYIGKTDYREAGAMERLFPTLADAKRKFVDEDREYQKKVAAVRKKLQPAVERLNHLAFLGDGDEALKALEALKATQV